MHRRLLTLCGIAVCLLCNAAPSWGGSPHSVPKAATVISVSGRAWWRAGPGAAWQPLLAGIPLPATAWLRTADPGAVRLVTAQGTLMRISAGREQALAKLRPHPAPTGAGIMALLHNLFRTGQRTRVAASEAAVSPNLAQPRTPVGQWQALMAGPTLTADQTEPVMRLASRFNQPGQEGRAAALLARLAHDLPGSPGLAPLALAAGKAFGHPATLQALRDSADGSRVAPDGSVVHTGQRLHLEYVASRETAPYIYLRTLPTKGVARTAALYPPRGTAGRLLTAHTALRLPASGKAYRLDTVVGREVLWAWVCTAPIANRTLLGKAVARVAATANHTAAALEPAIVRAAPYLCPQTVVLQFMHR